MADLILFVLSAYAAWYTFATAELPLWGDARTALAMKSTTFARFILCPICSGFWVSLVLSYVFPLTIGDIRWPAELPGQEVAGILVQAFGGAAAIYVIESHVARLVER